jgi:hypothetical protein
MSRVSILPEKQIVFYQNPIYQYPKYACSAEPLAKTKIGVINKQEKKGQVPQPNPSLSHIPTSSHLQSNPSFARV